MGFKKYRGPVKTVEHAMMAHAVLVIACDACGHRTSRWAWRIYHVAKERVAAMPLKKSVAGFWCSQCRKSVTVVMRAEGPWY